MVNWLDYALIVIFSVVIGAEIKRGFGRAIFDFAALLVTSRAAPMLISPLSKLIKFSEQPHVNETYAYALSFIIIGGILLFAGKMIYDATLISADTFDPLLGGVFGIGVGIILCHVLVRTLAISTGLDAGSVVITSSTLGKEFLTFDSYHNLLNSMQNFDREVPTLQ